VIPHPDSVSIIVISVCAV